jgi:rRNA-processing protein FCF1
VVIKVIIDSNFLLIPGVFKIDIFEALSNLLNQSYTPILLSSTQHELETIAYKGPAKLSKQAQLALKLAQKCQVFTVDKNLDETNDDVILQMAAQWKSPVATNDRALRKRLRDINIPVIYMRQKSSLQLEGSI